MHFKDWSQLEESVLSGNGFLEIRFFAPKGSPPRAQYSRAEYMSRVKWAYFNHIGTDEKFVANIVGYGKNPVYSKGMTYDDKDIFITSIEVMASNDISNVSWFSQNPALDDKTASRYVLFQKAWAKRAYYLKMAWRNMRYMPARVRRYIKSKVSRKPFWEQ